MQLQNTAKRPWLKAALLSAAALAALYIFRGAVIRVTSLVLGASVIAFLLVPLATLYEKRFPRSLSAVLSLVTAAAVLIGVLWLILPVIIHETTLLIRLLPRSLATLSDALDRVAGWFSVHFAGLSLKDGLFKGPGQDISALATSAFSMAGSVADAAGRISLSVVLSFFFLSDREALLLRLEMLIPQKHRPIAVRMGRAVVREMRMYLRGQITVASAVALLSTLGLLFLRVRGAFALGAMIGILNMIPYFGPFIGGVPAVLVALADSWRKAGLTLIMIVIVQQIDNSLISPRVMGNLTGMRPALVLICVFAGSQIAGIVGMLFALPAIMTFRTLFRVFVQRHENI